MTVDLGTSRTVGSVRVDRNAVTTFPAPGGDQGQTRPTVSADAQVQVSADGTTRRTLGTADGTRRRDVVAGDGSPVRFVRLVSVGASADAPLVVGELRIRTG